MNPKSYLLSLLARPGYEINKYRVQRWMQSCGLRLEMSDHARFSYDACNFVPVPVGKEAVIFDVGANIGQSSIWFSKSFPRATVYAFEPFAVIYGQLKKQLEDQPRMRCLQLAIGASDGEVEALRQTDPFSQCGQAVRANETHAETESLSVRKIDSFCAERQIEHVHILKTDTEGYDLDVLRGAEAMLRSGRISNIMTEASITPNDSQHTNLFTLIEHLRPFSFQLHGLYDLHHSREDGRLEYFNALFCLRQNTDTNIHPGS